MNKIQQQIMRYLLAMNASALDSAIHACVAFFGVAGAHAAIDAIPALSIQQFAAVFLLAFGRAILKYLDDHPLTALVPSDALDKVNLELAQQNGNEGKA